MTHLSSSTTAFETNTADVRSAQTKMLWSYSWEFDWSPAATASTHSLRAAQHCASADELAHMLDRALAYAG